MDTNHKCQHVEHKCCSCAIKLAKRFICEYIIGLNEYMKFL